jgi:hypothetical protein
LKIRLNNSGIILVEWFLSFIIFPKVKPALSLICALPSPNGEGAGMRRYRNVGTDFFI